MEEVHSEELTQALKTLMHNFGDMIAPFAEKVVQ
jgi:hypothetical protein